MPVAQPMLFGWVDCLTATDKATRLRVVLPIKNKKHVTLKAQLTRLLVAQGRPIKRLRCDHEFESEELEEWCLERGISIQYTPEREPESNGIAESTVRLLKEAGEGHGNFSEIGLLEADLRDSRVKLGVRTAPGGP